MSLSPLVMFTCQPLQCWCSDILGSRFIPLLFFSAYNWCEPISCFIGLICYICYITCIHFHAISLKLVSLVSTIGTQVKEPEMGWDVYKGLQRWTFYAIASSDKSKFPLGREALDACVFLFRWLNKGVSCTISSLMTFFFRTRALTLGV
jgi:hypothetical protein